MLRYILLSVLILSLATCVERYDPGLKGAQKYLIFEGTLTDAPGPYRFALTLSAGYNSDESIFDERVRGAALRITDDLNRRTVFTDDGRGGFTSPDNFRGEVGRSYTLTVTYNGQTYQSDPERLLPVPPIDTIYTSFRKITSPESQINGEFNVLVDVKDPAVEENYYQWDWIHYEKPDHCVLYTPPGSNVSYARRCCNDCWNISRSIGEIVIASDRLINGRRLGGQQVMNVPNDDTSPYYLRIGQQSLSRGAYQYWLAIRNLTGNVGGFFDVPPATLIGNLRNTNPSGPLMLGYFQVSARKEKLAYISRLVSPLQPFAKTLYPYWSTCESCTESPYRTSVRPEGWQ